MTSTTTPTATPITAPAGPPSNAVDAGGNSQAKPAGASLVPSSEVSGDDDDDLPVDVSASLAALSVDQLVALEAAGSNASAIAAAIGSSGVQPVPGVDLNDDDAVVIAPAQAPGTESTPVAPAPAPASAGRISLKGLPTSDADMVRTAIGAVKAGTYASITDAMAALFSPTPQAPVVAPAVAPVVDGAQIEDPAAGFDSFEVAEPQELLDLRSELERIDTDFATAKAAFDTIAQGDLLRERQDVIRKLDREESNFERTKAQIVQFEAAVDASSARALAQFPELTVEGSDFYNLISDEIILARSKGDDILNYPDWPEQIAIRTSEKLKRTTGVVSNPPNQPAPAAQIPAPPPSGVRMPGTLIGPGAQVAQLNAASAAAELEQMDPDEQIRALELADRRMQRR
jgi:hypothetical protein